LETEQEKSIWNTVSHDLFNAGILTLIDQNELGRYCRLFAEWIALQARIRAEGEIVKQYHPNTGAFIEWRENPAFRSAMKLNDALLRIEREFGMTPSARVRLVPNETAPDEDDFDDFPLERSN